MIETFLAHRRAALCPRALLLALPCALAAACAPGPPEATQHAGVQTIPLHVLARTIESHAGQTVRTCGRSLRRLWPEDDTAWMLSVRDPTSEYGFPALVYIRSCTDRRPRLVRGCIVGRVAREDGTLDPPTSYIVASHQISNSEWWLHQQCPA